jgi:NIPSNAP
MAIRYVRTVIAAPGKSFDAIAVAKESAAIFEKITGVKVTTFIRLGGPVGEITSVTNYASLGDLEDRVAKAMASAEWQAVTRKFEGLVVPGESGDRLLREV